MKHVACRRDAHWAAARDGFYDAFATGVGLGAPPKSNATYDLAQTAALPKGCFLPAGSSGKRKTNPVGSHQTTRTEPVVQIFDAKTRAGLRPSHDDEVYCRHCIEPQSCLAPARR